MLATERHCLVFSRSKKLFLHSQAMLSLFGYRTVRGKYNFYTACRCEIAIIPFCTRCRRFLRGRGYSEYLRGIRSDCEVAVLAVAVVVVESNMGHRRRRCDGPVRWTGTLRQRHCCFGLVPSVRSGCGWTPRGPPERLLRGWHLERRWIRRRDLLRRSRCLGGLCSLPLRIGSHATNQFRCSE